MNEIECAVIRYVEVEEIIEVTPLYTVGFMEVEVIEVTEEEFDRL